MPRVWSASSQVLPLPSCHAVSAPNYGLNWRCLNPRELGVRSHMSWCVGSPRDCASELQPLNCCPVGRLCLQLPRRRRVFKDLSCRDRTWRRSEACVLAGKPATPGSVRTAPPRHTVESPVLMFESLHQQPARTGGGRRPCASRCAVCSLIRPAGKRIPDLGTTIATFAS